MEEANEGKATGGEVQKSYFDVLGICCPSEVPLIEKILKPMEGVHKVSVVVPSKTVIVEHDPSLISQLQIVKALNQARLEAAIRVYGTNKIGNKWPSPYILACGVLLFISLFQRFFHPLQWLAVGAVAVGLPPIILRSIAAIRRYTLDINILMLIAVVGAVALKDYSEAGFIVFLFTVAEWLETMASHKATAGMSALMSMAPQKAVLAETGQIVDARDVKVSTILAIKAGEVIPIDGVVVEGKSEVNEQSLTGESFPVPKQAQSLVWAGTLNIDGYISVKTTALAEHSAVAKMARMVEEAQNSRSKTQRLIDSCAKYYTPAAVVVAGGVALVPIILRAHNPRHWIQLALVLLVSACPCALVLSTPVATFCALLKAARLGILVKGGDVLEALSSTRVVAFDKTGTITKGEFNVLELRPIGCQATVDTLLYWISSIESKSSHPMASALVEHARSNSIEPKPENVSEFQIYPGEGVYGEIDGKKIYIGNKRIATRAGCGTVPSLETEGEKEAVTIGYVFLETTLIGVFTLADSCRTGAAEAVRELQSFGIKVAMLTGDSTASAMHAQHQLGNAIEVLHAELLPEDKVRIVNDLKKNEGPTAMVGDGMNDAPALAAANVGISMGISGSAVAMETSHITLMSNDIQKIPKAIKLARKTHCKIMGNIIFSVLTKFAILGLAIAGHPLLWAAVLADVGTCLIVILNSLTLLRTRKPKTKKNCCRSSSESHVHNHVSAGSCSKPGNCCQGKVDASCAGSVGKEHTHKPAHEDHCLKECCPPRDHSHCNEKVGGHARSASHEHRIAAECKGEIHGARCEAESQQCLHEHKFAAECQGEIHGERCEAESQQRVHDDCCHEPGADNHDCDGHIDCTVEQHDAHDVDSCCNGCVADDHSSGAHGKHGTVSNSDDCCSGVINTWCDSGTQTREASDQHVVFIGSEGDQHESTEKVHCPRSREREKRGCCSSSTDIVHGHAVKEDAGGCCKTKEREKKGCCSSSTDKVHGHAVKEDTADCCKSKEREKKGCCSSSDRGSLFERSNTGGCCRKDYEKAVCCSTATHGLRRRGTGACCQSYKKMCGKRDRCCAGGIAHLPEIVIE